MKKKVQYLPPGLFNLPPKKYSIFTSVAAFSTVKECHPEGNPAIPFTSLLKL